MITSYMIFVNQKYYAWLLFFLTNILKRNPERRKPSNNLSVIEKEQRFLTNRRSNIL